MQLEFRVGDVFCTTTGLILLICLLVAAGQNCLGGSSYDQDWSIQQTADGTYVVAGYTYSNDSNAGASGGFSDRWKVLLKPSGDMDWQKRPNGTAQDEAYRVRRTADGTYVAASASYGDANGNDGPAEPWIIRQGETNCTIAAPDTVCSGSAGNAASATESADTYAWSITNGAITSESNAKFISFTAGSSGTTRLALILTKKGTWNECHKDLAIKLLPDCSWSSNAPVCNGTPVQFTGPAGMDTYLWELGDGSISTEESPRHTYSGPGTYPVKLTVTKDGCSRACEGSVTVKPLPDCSWSSSAPVCNGTPVRFTGPAGMDSYKWEFGDGFASIAKDPVYLYPAPGTYAVNLRVAKGGCSKSCPGKVEIRGLDCGWTSSSPVCDGTPVQFTGPAEMDSYRWEFGDGQSSSAQGPSHLYYGPGTYTVNLTVAKGGCAKVCTGSIEVRPRPDCSWTSNTPVCNGTPVHFTGPAGMGSYRWDFGDGQTSSEKDPYHLYSAAGTYKVILQTAKGGCWTDCTKDISVNAWPDCTITAPDAVCSGSRDNAASTMNCGATYAWSINNGRITSANNTPLITFAAGASGTTRLQITVTSASGCSKGCTKDVSILPRPACIWSSSSPVCDGTPVQFTAPAGMDSHFWNFGDGQNSSTRDPSHLYSGPGTYSVSLTVAKNGCQASCQGPVLVSSRPACIWSSDSPVCAGTPVHFTGPAGIDSYWWDFGDGDNSTTQDPSHLYFSPGTYLVSLTVTKGVCQASSQSSVVVNSHPDCGWSSSSPVCDGTPVQFTAPAGMDSYFWNFGDGQNSSTRDPSHLYSGPGTYSVSLTVAKNGCQASSQGIVLVNSYPDSSWSSDSPVCAGTPVHFTGPAGMDSYWWEFGDGDNSTTRDPSHLYFSPGTYSVSLTVTKGGCQASSQGTVLVNSRPACSWSSDAPVCAGTPVQFTAPAGMDAYLWDFGDGAVSSDVDPVHLYSAPGSYAVTLTATKGSCWKDCTKDVAILPRLDCSIAAPDTVWAASKGYTASVAAGASYDWSISNGEITSAVDGQSISFTAGASGNVRLTVNVTRACCRDECYKDIAIKLNPDSSFAFDLAALNSPAEHPSRMLSHEGDNSNDQARSRVSRLRIYPG
jgi:PKD repeat protein